MTKKKRVQNQQIADWLELSERTFHFARYARMWFTQGDFETRRAIFNCLGSHLWLGDQKIKVEWRKVFNIIIESLPAAEAEIGAVRTPLDTQNILTDSGQVSTLVLDSPIGRKGRDSNPRGRLRPGGFQDRSFQPLTHPSVVVIL